MFIFLTPIMHMHNVRNGRYAYDRCALFTNVQYNLSGSNTDGSFTVDDSNSFFSPYKLLSIKYLMIFFLFYYGIVCCCTH